MHKIHVTEALVLAKRGVGEANTSVALLTHELGLVRAKAQSARLGKSKLRYGLEPLTHARFSLVRGRSEWKLVGVERVSQPCAHAPTVHLQAMGRISKLLLRLVVGEEPVPQLYKIVVEGFNLLSSEFASHSPSAEDGSGVHVQQIPTKAVESVESVEIILVLRILAQLGYLPQTPALAPFVASAAFSPEFAAQVVRSRSVLIKTINESLQSSGL